MKSFSKSSFPLFLSFQEKLFPLKSNGRIYSTLLLNNKINKLCGKKEDFVNYDAIFMILRKAFILWIRWGNFPSGYFGFNFGNY
jgi:hypothetical protein